MEPTRTSAPFFKKEVISLLTGTFINTATVLGGSLIGLLLKWLAGRFSVSERVSDLGSRLQDTIMKGVALCVLYIGISGALEGSNTLVAIISMALGGILGANTDLILNLYSAANRSKSDVIGTYVYRVGLGIDGGTGAGVTSFSSTGAIGLFSAVINITMLFIANTISNKLTDTGLW